MVSGIRHRSHLVNNLLPKSKELSKEGSFSVMKRGVCYNKEV